MATDIWVLTFECLNGFLLSFCDHKISLFVIPGRNSVSPPELATDAPISDIFHPVAIKIFELEGIKFYFFIDNCIKGGLVKFFHINPPLQGEAILHHHVCSLAESNLVRVILDFYQVALCLQVLCNFLSCFKTVGANV